MGAPFFAAFARSGGRPTHPRKKLVRSLGLYLRANSHVCQNRANMGHPKIENVFSFRGFLPPFRKKREKGGAPDDSVCPHSFAKNSNDDGSANSNHPYPAFAFPRRFFPRLLLFADCIFPFCLDALDAFALLWGWEWLGKKCACKWRTALGTSLS